jgi:phosphoesterase RecJ-like protein
MPKVPSHRREAAREIAGRLKSARSIAIATHVGGDGDGWGSACALAHHFAPRGVDVRLLAGTPMPDRFDFMLPEGFVTLAPDGTGIEALETADVQLVVDASEYGRLGEFGPHYDAERTIVIDHHAVATKQIEACVSLIDPSAAATAELIYDVLAQGGEPIGAGTASALYVGLVMDTGSFRYSNSTPHAHRLAAVLIEAGADPEALYRPLFANLKQCELGTLRAALEGLQVDDELGLAWSVLGLDVVKLCGALDEYEGIIDHIRNIEGVEIAVLFREREGGEVKVSFRSTGTADVASVAGVFQGGGHKKASGATLSGALQEVTERVLEECRVALRERSEAEA